MSENLFQPFENDTGFEKNGVWKKNRFENKKNGSAVIYYVSVEPLNLPNILTIRCQKRLGARSPIASNYRF